ncbi:hypothetical protein LINPERHAP1_LOCUS35889 [Linum perenne]
MPDNEVGSRIHNFFGQEISSQVQQHSQIGDAPWPGISMNPWGGSRGQITTPFNSDLKSRSLQQSVADYEGGYDSQPSTGQHDMRFRQSAQITEHGRSQSQGQQPAINGYFQGHQGSQMRQDEMNYLGVDTESDLRNLTAKGFSMFDSHQGNGSEHNARNLARIQTSESPVNFNFFGGQHQMSAHHREVMQSLPRQPVGFGDIFLQQQLIHKQMQEFQRQRQLQMLQLQQQDSRHLNSLNQGSSLGKQTPGSQSQSLINGIPVQDASGFGLQPEIMAANTNWQQQNMSQDMRGSSSGLQFHTEQNQALQLMGMVPQQADQSLYGVPISGTRVNSNPFPYIQVDKASGQKMSSNSNSFLANQYNGSSNDVNVQDGTLVSRPGYQVRNEIGRVNSEGFDSGINLKHLQQLSSHEGSGLAEEYHTSEQGIPSEISQKKADVQLSSQNVTKLDPTEEKFLYGSDDNLWDAFSSTNPMGSGGFSTTKGADTLDGAFPSLQNGTWSALMQSAVAETSSVDVNTPEEWSGSSGQTTEPHTGTRHLLSVNDTGKQQTAWEANCLQTASTLDNTFNRSGNNDTSMDSNSRQRVDCSVISSSHDVSERPHVDSFRKLSQQFEKGNNKLLDGSHQQEDVDGSHNHEKVVHTSHGDPSAKGVSHPWTNQSGFSLHNLTGQKFNGKTDQGRISAPFTHGSPYIRTYSQDLNTHDTGGEATVDQSVNETFDNFVSQMKQTNESVDGARSSHSGQASVPDTPRGTTFNDVASSVQVPCLNNHQNDKDSGQHFPVLEPISTSQSYAVSALVDQDEFPQMSLTMQTSTSSKLPSVGIPPFRGLSNVPDSDIQSNSISKTTSWPQKLVYQKDQNQQISLANDFFAQKVMSSLQGNDLIRNRGSSLNASSFVSAQMDIAAFGCSLRPNASLNQNYSMLHRVDDMKNVEIDPNDRSLKRLKASDGWVDPQLASSGSRPQLYGHNNMVRGAPLNNACSSPDDPNLVSISARQTDDQGPNLPSQDMHQFGGNSPRNFADPNVAASSRDEHSKISLQIAPSWFNQYGTLKNGQVLSTYNAGKAYATKHAELTPTWGRFSNALPASSSLEAGNSVGDISNQHGLLKRSFPQLSRPDAVDMSLFVARPKKRKSATCDLVPWHKEVFKIPQRLRNLSFAESEWAKTVNRVSEKVEDDSGIALGGPPSLKSKRRLILTTQLMQLLLHPPPAWVMSADAVPHYESAAHFVARATLGDVCGSLSGSANDTSPPINIGQMLPESRRMSKAVSDQYFLKVVEDLINRTRKVESDLPRLDKSLSVLDLRVECDDLERFSVFNRFAKFHSPGQTGGADTSSSPGSGNVQMYFLQRYVTAVPFPRNVPDRVTCLSL